MPPRRLAALVLLASPAAAACSSGAPIISLDVTAGQEADAFTRDPAVVRVDVHVTAVEGDVDVTASAAPGGTFDLGDLPGDHLLSFEATGVDAKGEAVLRGRTVSGLYASSITGTLPLFVERLGGWSRPSGAMVHAHVGGTVGVLGERYLTVVGGAASVGAAGMVSPADPDYFDVITLASSAGTALPRTPGSMVVRSDAALVVDAQGATWVTFSDGTFSAVPAPAGLAYADVAGGRAVEAPDGRTFVVGGTRSGAPSGAVLVVGNDGTLSALKLVTPRAGASAVWTDGGLVVAGGSATGAGVEVLGTSATAFSATRYPPDPVVGAAAVWVKALGVVLIGGTSGAAAAPTRTVDPGCVAGCSAKVAKDVSLPAAFASVAAYAMPSGALLAVGQEAATSGATRTFLVDIGGGKVTELPLREPRKGASVTPAPSGTLAVIGGTHPDGTPALSVELLFPQ